MDHVDFITTDTGDDLIVSFAICGNETGEVCIVTLLRTPKYEFILGNKALTSIDVPRSHASKST